MPLSAVLITRNAGAALQRCLASLAFVDEIVVVDSGSTDQTLAVCQAHGAHVVQQEWLGFGPQKQFAVKAARFDWVLCLDADEEISDALKQSIVKEMEKPASSAYVLARRNRFLGRWLKHGEGYPDWQLRLFHRQHARWSDDPVHERVLVNERPGRLKGDLLHHSSETLHHYLDKQNRYTTLQAERLHHAGKSSSILRLVIAPLVRFLKFYVFRLGFLDGAAGFIHIAIGCMNSFNKYSKLLALNKGAA